MSGQPGSRRNSPANALDGAARHDSPRLLHRERTSALSLAAAGSAKLHAGVQPLRRTQACAGSSNSERRLVRPFSSSAPTPARQHRGDAASARHHAPRHSPLTAVGAPQAPASKQRSPRPGAASRELTPSNAGRRGATPSPRLLVEPSVIPPSAACRSTARRGDTAPRLRRGPTKRLPPHAGREHTSFSIAETPCSRRYPNPAPARRPGAAARYRRPHVTRRPGAADEKPPTGAPSPGLYQVLPDPSPASVTGHGSVQVAGVAVVGPGTRARRLRRDGSRTPREWHGRRRRRLRREP